VQVSKYFFCYCTVFFVLGCERSAHSDQVSDVVSSAMLVALRMNEIGRLFDHALNLGIENYRSVVNFSPEENLEMKLKENLCIQGDYCWQPMRDWPGQYEIRVDGVLKPDGTGWDLWSGELTEEQPFPSYSHFVLNTNTNQLHVVVDTGRVTD